MVAHLLAASAAPAACFAAAIKRDPHYWPGVCIVFAIFGGSFALVAFISVWIEKKRTRALSDLAASLGFEFFPKGDVSVYAALDRFPLMGVGRKRKITNLMSSTSANFQLNIFDYSYVTGRGRSQRNHKQTVAYLQSPALAMPNFTLAPKRFWDAVRSLLGKQTVQLDGNPAFASSYVLQCNEKRDDAVRAYFTDEVQQFYVDRRGLFAQGSRNQLLLFRGDKRSKPEEINALMEEALGLLSLLLVGMQTPPEVAIR